MAQKFDRSFKNCKKYLWGILISAGLLFGYSKMSAQPGPSANYYQAYEASDPKKGLGLKPGSQEEKEAIERFTNLHHAQLQGAVAYAFD